MTSREEIQTTLGKIDEALQDIGEQHYEAAIHALWYDALRDDVERGVIDPADYVVELNSPPDELVARARMEALSLAERHLELVREAAGSSGDLGLRMDKLQEMVLSLRDQSPQMPKLPTLSAAVGPVIRKYREAKPKSTYYRRMENGVRRFIEVKGDLPVDQYVPLDMQDFANLLARVPACWDKEKELVGMTFPDAADYNDRHGRPFSTLSVDAVNDYLRSFVQAWKRATRGLYGVRELGLDGVVLPEAASDPIEREPLTPEKLSKWFALAAAARRPADKWLPLLGLLTGARLGELVGIQSQDIKRVHGFWTVDLRQAHLVNGQKQNRAVKNRQSKRLFTLHTFLDQAGFVDWACSRSGFIFEDLHVAENPAKTAGARMRRQMKKAGVHVTRSEVFHSLRHTAKDWMDDRKLSEKTADRQVGHRPATVGRRYGEKTLRASEIEQLATLPLPEGVDFSPYLASAPRGKGR